MANFSGVNNKGLQAAPSNPQVIKKNAVELNRGATFQAALNQANSKKIVEEKKKESFTPAPSATPNQATPNTGFASSTNESNTSLRGHMGTGRNGSGFRDEGAERVQQELNNQLIQSGLQAQVLKSTSTSGQDNS